MNTETLRGRILDYTKREMSLHGVSGLTMDDIARGMKMSKRTLYKLFPSKAYLFRICLSDSVKTVRSHIQQKQLRMDSSCMDLLFMTANGYLTLLYSLGKTLLLDINADKDYRSSFEREEAFWLQQFIDVLTHCKICGYLLPEVEPESFATDLQEVIYKSCLQGTPYVVQRMMNYTLLRGLFRVDGIRYIDEHLEPDKFNVCV
ncbi:MULTISPECIES: TetR/AcrR family transcriptional regulator [unclassified Bacteroides]|uniref:TetR/AcrR family transcriptional regulator n=1 Tax=unclassified Bacteroides TaxID=2646097 RepID=UPI00168BDF7B|nr:MULTISPECIES: TetR/AcrR family transcriptional regulator [unclassified Bacteroides]MBD3591966.1 TetR/AcrR family transcriptional regulator [Bacteroides sp. GM023]